MTARAARPTVVRLDAVLGGLLVVAAAVQAFSVRDGVAVDGVSYFDLAGRLRDGDWNALIDRYWSPLYPMILSLTMTVTGGTRDVEPWVAHAVNVVIFAVGVVAFGSVIRAMRTLQARDDRVWIIDARTAHGTTILYTLFACGALRYTNVKLVTPDLCVLVVYVGMLRAILQAQARTVGAAADVGFGVLLAVGYAAKAAMLPISVGALVAYSVVRGSARRAATARAVVVQAILCVPYVLLLSRAEGRFTTGEAGPLNVSWYVAGVSAQIPDPAATGIVGIESSWVRVVDSPATYVFPEPRSGTYPAWSDPARWQRGLRSDVTMQAGIRNTLGQLREYHTLFGALVLGAILIVVLHAGRSASTAMLDRRAAVGCAVVAAAAIVLYALVHVEARFFGGVVIAAGVAVSLVVAESARSRWFLAAAIAFAGAASLLLWPVAVPSVREALAAGAAATGIGVWIFFRRGVRSSASVTIARGIALTVLLAPVVGGVIRDAEAAVAVARGARVEPAILVADFLERTGVRRGTVVGSIGASTPAAWARRSAVTIVAEVAVRDTALFWRSSPDEQAVVLAAMTNAGARAVVGRSERSPGGNWRHVPGTDYWVLPLDGSGSATR